MNGLKAFLRWCWDKWYVVLAGIFTAAETLVSAGVELPGSKHIGPEWRSLIYGLAISGGFILRWYALRKGRGRDDE